MMRLAALFLTKACVAQVDKCGILHVLTLCPHKSLAPPTKMLRYFRESQQLLQREQLLVSLHQDTRVSYMY